MKKRTYTIESFPKEFFDIWQLAEEGKLSLEMPTKGQATHLKQRLYIFRKTLLETSPDLAQPYLSVDIRVEEEEDKFQLVSYVPAWKLQVRKERESTVTLPVDTMIQELTHARQLQEEEEGESTNALETTLSNLGFTSK